MSRDEFVFHSQIEPAVSQQDSPPLITLSLIARPTTSDPAQPIDAFEKPVRLFLQARLGSDFQFETAKLGRARLLPSRSLESTPSQAASSREREVAE